MLYAIPCRDLHVGNHFARSPEIAIVDEQQQIKQLIPLVESDSPCNKKKQWMSVVKSYDVKAVVVRHIGKKMLAHLFNNDIRVFASKGKAELVTLDFNNLQEVTELDYGRESRNSGCSKKTCVEKGHKKETSILTPQLNRFSVIRGIRK
ncbi:putative Fe-Mo cluster-binding NifX family protein [Vibrio crassostreae]|uniref:NifB/NifX family molybdenum-iron cluster-binding protein n=1 Tax=Vibrio crassostreae TaxID=246167 RepID=UPI000F4AE567|nr:NifB/NifX family molybdenum-iron cluster-binding protein [Vibrio crassostreae]ROR26729.1 putative Fe-Mo cluster-binding NifX family protein [Vibrio crassostreae]